MSFWRRRRDIGPLEGEQARRRAEEELNKTVAETPLYAALGESLRQLREANHFAQAIRDSMGGRR
ncbi:hypothetical protein [Nocardioides sp. SR21]|uniref:DUF7620 family protein n=1 Tax=Nocardioides sp. SR21 TaxID=2919501 RepID=UPI001FAAC787|nr:hypothetical protein [Nocardioides sp. SR21]